jgi:hypothetical protein
MTATKPPYLLLNASANATGTTFDLGATPGANIINYQITAPGTVTASTVTINGSNDGTTWVAITSVANSVNAAGTVREPSYRYYQGVLANYAGTGKVKCVLEAASRKYS